MNAPPDISKIPRARIRRVATLSFIWLVPLIAGIAALILVARQIRKIGPAITIEFDSGSGLEVNQTVVRFRGVRVGKVTSVEISPDTGHVEVGVRLSHSASRLAREGSVFWVVRPQVGAGGIHAIETIVSGPYIQVQPGNPNGKKQTHFIGASEPPPVKPSSAGKQFILRSPRIGSLSPGSPVFYRGIEVGSVEYLSLSEDSTMVEIHVVVKSKFAPLIRANTVWWNAGGIDMDLHLFGVNLSAENFKSLVVGGVSFATPNNEGALANTNTIFPLYDKADPQWLDWAAVIPITNSITTVPLHPTESNPEMDLNDANQQQQQ
ncbi:MAG TPA: MlaD family protein [Verrucomicrobiae bacterium]|nr:MlaD family protein [Verrucomicrobiae bacterium]